MRTALDKKLRSQLEAAVEKARDVAELAAKEELDRLGVGEKQAPDYLSQDQCDQRNRLRAHGRFLGDIRRASGEQEVFLLITEIAYEQWHRMLFSRFLAENDLLMYEDGVTALAISDCFDLAEEETGDSSKGWQYAANYASKMLPQIFRNDSPVLELEFSPNHQKKLEQLLEGLDEETFQAQDSLGWVYQFWQSKRKDEVNKSEVKIGAKELSPVTQLFTEPYMVSFLLDNALGAWWANQQLSEQDYVNASSEKELRDKVAIDGVPLEYLRFVRTYTEEQQALMDNAESEGQSIEKPEPTGPWKPAAGKFEQWPEDLCNFKTLDPCCGSGHFLVAVFLMLIPIRIRREGLTESQAVDAVLTENIYGLELDQRCIEIAVFALALEAWRYPNGGGYRQLPELHLACSGLSIKAAKDEWKNIGLGKKNLSIAMDWMYKEFSDAPILGSLLNPKKSNAASIVGWDELSQVIYSALDSEEKKENSTEGGGDVLEAAVAAQGMAKAAEILVGKYHSITTNVPYLGQKKYADQLREFIQKYFSESKSDLALAFTTRLSSLLVDGGVHGLVLPQGWLVQSNDYKFRGRLLNDYKINIICTLGSNAFSKPVGAQVMLMVGEKSQDSDKNIVYFSDSSYENRYEEKSKILMNDYFKDNFQRLMNRDRFDISPSTSQDLELIGDYADSLQGLSTGEKNLFERFYWEVKRLPGSGWEFLHETSSGTEFVGGRRAIILWERESGRLAKLADSLKHLNHSVQSWRRGKPYWGKDGIAVNRMGNLHRTLYSGDKFSVDVGVISPHKSEYLLPLYTFAMSDEFVPAVRSIYSKPEVPMSYLVNVPFNMTRWKKVAQDKFPNGLPLPFGNHPDDWTFHGHPCGSVIWDAEEKSTVISDLRADETVLQVTLARLLGYQWPAELDSEINLAGEQRELVQESKKLLPFTDDDGIVCLPAVRGEKPADQRVEELLQAAYGDAWSTQIRNQLLESVGCKNKSLSFWLQEKFFEQHCKSFQHRPFIWHVWDGLKDGFSALVNYHQLDKKNLERLIYTYLDDWIRTQSHQQSEGVDGANERLIAAQNLKQRLELILEGEAPYDIFVRWKPLQEQPIGWSPDLNGGVRLNIRPFITAGVLRHNKKPKLNIHWNKDRGKDVESAPWYDLGVEYGGKEGDRINDHHISLAEKQNAKV